MITHFIESYSLIIDKKDDFRKEVFSLSIGNASTIKEICRYADKDEYNDRDDITSLIS
ncbi:hypothetical protein SCALIN_C47_0039 [Candidatus Scalindua japonica]|uniref:Uncharacterized protein n=1 Tax=Candidatus Scalindua japonica TaxID=1284222 RepID=A0A286U4I9_9BACT|nr:hypothetical protein [Candidatus Scalindua japonica]GAX63068.1 hypothetical protein SCALIN_C47_0039 [Candidatus Scalindua japonica]